MDQNQYLSTVTVLFYEFYSTNKQYYINKDENYAKIYK